MDAALDLYILHEFVEVQNTSEDNRITSWLMHNGALQHRISDVFHELNKKYYNN